MGQSYSTCKKCKGSGQSRQGACVTCRGSGRVFIKNEPDGSTTVTPAPKENK